jgi:polysaccharide biosynthesis protein PslJ
MMMDLRLQGPIAWNRVQEALVHRNPWVRRLTTLALCLAVGLPIGAVIGLLGPIYGSAALIALVVGYAMLRSVLVGLVVVIAVICLLPFAALPIDIGFSPTFLDLALVAVFFVWVTQMAGQKDYRFLALPPILPVIVFLGLAAGSFIAGLTHSALTANVVRHFGEIILSVLLFVLVTNAVRTRAQLKLIVGALIVAGFLAALVGVVLYALPETLQIRLLSTLRVVRYPTGSDVLRYIEDNPDLQQRATSTSVDPNVLGGMLIFVAAITGAQLVAARPILPRGWLAVAFLVIGACMVLTYSRGAFGGMAAALVLLGLLRYRKMLLIFLAASALLLLLPAARPFIERFVEGVQGQDLATQMRFGEYRDAVTLIGRYPWFGVGFAGTPHIDTYLGVSNVYLLVAEEMGLIGLAGFLVALGRFQALFVSTWRRRAFDAELEPTLLGCCLAVAGAMVGGIFDHYFFNLDFPHAAALLWLVVGLGAVTMRLGGEEGG